jgi:hypothetical protein
MKKLRYMEGESRNLEKNTNWEPSDLVHDDSTIFQSVRVRHSSVLADRSNWKFVESELRFVLRCGTILWLLYLLSLAL